MPSDRWKIIARTSAYLLLVAIAVSVVTGWGITRTDTMYRISFGLIDRGRADAIHRGAQIPMIGLFLIHVLVNARLGLSKGFPRGTIAVSAVTLAVGVLLFAGAIYMETR